MKKSKFISISETARPFAFASAIKRGAIRTASLILSKEISLPVGKARFTETVMANEHGLKRKGGVAMKNEKRSREPP